MFRCLPVCHLWKELKREMLPHLRQAWQMLVGSSASDWWHTDPQAIQCAHCGCRFPLKDLPYDVKHGSLPQHLSAMWSPLKLDTRTSSFLREAFELPAWRVLALSLAGSWLRKQGFSLTDSNALVGRGDLFVLSQAQAQQLLGHPGGVLVDVGAGAGCVTQELAPLFDAVVACEASWPMARCLRKLGFAVHTGTTLDGLLETTREQGVSLGEGASVVALLNVLDRCDDPRVLLRDAAALLRPGGVLLIAVVLPFRPFVEDGMRKRPPSFSLGLNPDAGFEHSAALLWEKLLAPSGLNLEHFARVPYLSQGDQVCRVYSLEDSIWVLRRGDATQV